jgi:hypothetical protein
MEEFAVSYNSITRANQIELILSSELFNINYKCIKSEEIMLLKNNDCNTIIEYLEKVIELLKNQKYSNNL